MAKYLKMIGVLVGISLFSGLVLGGVNNLTEDKIKRNVLEFKKVPAVINIAEGFLGNLDETQKKELTNNLLNNYRELDIGEEEPLTLFVVEKDGKPYMIAFDAEGEGGYGGNVGIMLGLNLETGNVEGLGITVDSETPGLGKKVREQDFLKQFRGMKLDSVFKIKKDGGTVDAVSGASKSSRAVCDGITRAIKLYGERADEIKQKAQEPPAHANQEKSSEDRGSGQ